MSQACPLIPNNLKSDIYKELLRIKELTDDEKITAYNALRTKYPLYLPELFIGGRRKKGGSVINDILNQLLGCFGNNREALVKKERQEREERKNEELQELENKKVKNHIDRVKYIIDNMSLINYCKDIRCLFNISYNFDLLKDNNIVELADFIEKYNTYNKLKLANVSKSYDNIEWRVNRDNSNNSYVTNQNEDTPEMYEIITDFSRENPKFLDDFKKIFKDEKIIVKFLENYPTGNYSEIRTQPQYWYHKYLESLVQQQGGKSKLKVKKTLDKIIINNRSHVVYVGSRGGKYVKKNGEYISFKSATKLKK